MSPKAIHLQSIVLRQQNAQRARERARERESEGGREGGREGGMVGGREGERESARAHEPARERMRARGAKARAEAPRLRRVAAATVDRDVARAPHAIARVSKGARPVVAQVEPTGDRVLCVGRAHVSTQPTRARGTGAREAAWHARAWLPVFSSRRAPKRA
jgi:hypothetical protein